MTTENILWCIQNCAAYVAHDDAIKELAALTERIEYANAGDLVTIPRELVLAMEAKMKAQAETIARLEAELAQCKHALDDEGEDVCTCGHSLDSHTKSGVHPCGECECLMFWAKVTK